MVAYLNGRNGVMLRAIRDDKGEWVHGWFCWFCHLCNVVIVLKVDILAILKGSEFAWLGGFMEIIFEIDSLDAYKVVATTRCIESNLVMHACCDISREIHVMLKRHWSVRFFHVVSSANKYAMARK